MSAQVAVGFSANPNAIIDSFRRIQEEAKRTNRELKSIADIDFPGLEDAAQELRDMQRGFSQLFAKGLKGDTSAALRSGAKSGIYDKDFVSWAGNVQRQFPDQKELIRHIKSVIDQTQRMLRLNTPGGGSSPISPSSPLPPGSSPLPPRTPLPPGMSPLPGSSPLPPGGMRNWSKWGGTLPGHGGMRNWPAWGGTLPGIGGGGYQPFPNVPWAGGDGSGRGAHYANTLIGGMVGGNFGGAVGGLAGGGVGSIIGGGLGWILGKNPVTAAAGAEIGSNIGSAFGGAAGGKFQGAVNHYTDMTVQEAFGMTDLRRGISAMNQDFESFRKSIRAAGEGLDVTFNESLAMSRLYTSTAGSTGSAATSLGASRGMLLSRAFGMELGQGTGMMGRAGWLGLKNGDAKEQMMMLAQVLEGSHLGGRQAEAADAMLKFAEKSASMMGDGGNVEGYTAKLLALFNSKDEGVKANAGNIMSGLDSSIRNGGGTPGANIMMRNTLQKNGVTSHWEQEMAMAEGFGYQIKSGPNKGRMLGMLALSETAMKSGGDKYALGTMMRDSWGIPGNLGMKAVPDILKSLDILDPKMKRSAEARIAEYLKGVGPDSENDADKLRMAYAAKSNAAQALLGDNMMPIVQKYTEAMGDMTKAINSWLGTGKTSEWSDPPVPISPETPVPLKLL